MNPYNCISMEYRIGMIEIVLNAETIANIQKEKGGFTPTSAFKKGSLLGKNLQQKLKNVILFVAS